MKKQKGFTLIELLIVIIIIGILAGVLIAVLNPIKQRVRAQNAALKSAVEKVSFAINSYRSATGKLPDEVVLASEVENLTLLDDCDTATELDCSYSFSGTKPPATCDGGTGQCTFRLYSAGESLSDGYFRITVKKHIMQGETDGYYIFDSSAGLFECTDEADNPAAEGTDCVSLAE